MFGSRCRITNCVMSLSVTKALVFFERLKQMYEKRRSQWFVVSLVHLFNKRIHAYSLENVCECQKNKAIIVIYVKICLPFIFTRQNTLHSDINHLHLLQVNQEALLADTDYISTGVTESTHAMYSLFLVNCIPNYIPYMWFMAKHPLNALAETQLRRVSDKIMVTIMAASSWNSMLIITHRWCTDTDINAFTICFKYEHKL